MGGASTRIEHDSLGPVEMPADALSGARTVRGVANFRVSGVTCANGRRSSVRSQR
jgi:aspartate ammonia-lyase